MGTTANCGESNMKLVVFGLTMSSSWGNGHATLWRGLFRALCERGHEPVFFERDVEYYAAHRDMPQLPAGRLCLYSNWEEARAAAMQELAGADVGMVTSYCPDGVAASELVLGSAVPMRCFYDMDTPVTLDCLRAGKPIAYLSERGLQDFDLVLSYTGGEALRQLQQFLGARRVAPLYGSVDPEIHHPVTPDPAHHFRLSYLGTFAEDRQRTLEQLFIEPARRLPEKLFCLGGAQYKADFPWTDNIFFRQHVPPAAHAQFYCSSDITLNVTRRAMRDMGYCPSGRLFEAASCGVPLLSDTWEGLDQFFTPGQEILTAETTEEAIGAVTLGDNELRRIATAARERTLAEHTAVQRVVELERILQRTAEA